MTEKLVENIIWQADYFLKECGEFYPFASIINDRDEVRPLGILLKNEKPSPFEVIEELSGVLKLGKEKGEYKAYAIGINISLNIPDASQQDAIEIRIQNEGMNDISTYQIPYYLNELSREIEYGDFIQKE